MSSLHDRIGPVESRIVSKVVRRALGFGWLVTVFDGEEDAVDKSDDFASIVDEVGHTDQTYLKFFHDGSAVGMPVSCVGVVWFVHGNEEDVITDHTDNDPMNELVAGIL